MKQAGMHCRERDCVNRRQGTEYEEKACREKDQEKGLAGTEGTEGRETVYKDMNCKEGD